MPCRVPGVRVRGSVTDMRSESVSGARGLTGERGAKRGLRSGQCGAWSERVERSFRHVHAPAQNAAGSGYPMAAAHLSR